MNPKSLENLKPFKEGHDERRNMKGNTSGESLTAIIRRLAEGLIDLEEEGGVKRRVTRGEAVALKLFSIIESTKSNDMAKLKAIAEILDRTDGKATQTINQTNDGTVTVIREGDSYPPIIHSPSGAETDIRE